MYTQCPDCSTAFRVTAEVLKQAAGKVRCGGCGYAFNALAYLSESLPEQSEPQNTDGAPPELEPETLPSDSLPASISAEQSAALLKTLDELAGSDIRIEDTGVEWRVLDDDEIGVAAADEVPVATPDEDLVIDEILDESPTPVDQFLTETPAVVDSPEIFEAPPPEFSRTSVDEIRFDDNTPLPDDFGLDDDGYVEGDFEAHVAPEDPIDEEPEEVVQEDPQADLDLSEPDEWSDILGEFEDLAEAVAGPEEERVDVAPEAARNKEPESESESVDELDAPEIPGEADDVDEPLDMDTQFALQAEAMGIDLSGMHETVQAEDDAAAEEEVDLDELLKESTEEDLELEDLLDEELVDEIDEDDLEALSEDATQLDLIEDEDEDEEIFDQDAGEEETAEDLEAELEFDPDEELEDQLEDEPEAELDVEFDEEPEAELDVEFDEEPEAELESELDEETSGGHYVPPMTEEEQTINMQIDQDLLALAIEDEDGFASTIIIPERAPESKVTEDREARRDDEAGDPLSETGSGFETIIMEGEAFRSAEGLDKLEVDTAAAALLAGAAAADREAETPATAGGRRYGLIGGIVVLVLLLAVQGVHQRRHELATIPAFNEIAGPLYRAIGQPFTPDWNVRGWRFETTRHVVESAEESSASPGTENVVIFSRLGNNSEESLPYPIIVVALTDRFEEPLGNVTLGPADYLPSNLDPRKLVEPGNSFEASMTLKSPPPEAASFRLRPCYRTTDGLLRCKDDGFK